MGLVRRSFPSDYYSVPWKAIMPRSTKANLHWIDEEFGSKIAGGLSERYARPMIYRQSGPYNQSKTPHVGIFFNDPILHHIGSVNPAHKVDFRFGFYLERCFSSETDDYVIIAGFQMLNPTLSVRFLMPNLRADHATVAVKLVAWLRRHGADGGYVRFSTSDGREYIADGPDGQGRPGPMPSGSMPAPDAKRSRSLGGEPSSRPLSTCPGIQAGANPN